MLPTVLTDDNLQGRCRLSQRVYHVILHALHPGLGVPHIQRLNWNAYRDGCLLAQDCDLDKSLLCEFGSLGHLQTYCSWVSAGLPQHWHLELVDLVLRVGDIRSSQIWRRQRLRKMRRISRCNFENTRFPEEYASSARGGGLMARASVACPSYNRLIHPDRTAKNPC